ncbi:MAG: efflux RND transporter periplasmic adaptor subunit [Spirochaetales bacterium]|nr:efflux RND transporter periplasmic adaptor subunit [Spirochaetales bacterium]
MNKSIGSIAVVALVLAIAVSCSKPDAVAGATAWEPGQVEESLAVESLTVARSPLVDDVRASGVVAGVREAFVVAETQGLVKSVGFSLGDKVAEGQELLRVDDKIASLNLERAKEQYEAARLELEATEALSAAGRSSPADLTRARGNYSGAKAQYETALKAYNDTRLRAPVTGVIASREEVATVGASIAPGARVARIVDTSSFKITVGVGEREVGLIDVGAPVRVYVPAALGDEYVEGTVEAIAAGSNPATGSFPVVVAFRNGFSGRVKSGMSASVSIEARKVNPAVVVPSAALVRRGSTYAVFVDDGGKAAVREVSLGRRSGVRVEVLNGLAEGERLLVSALTKLRPGVPVVSTDVGDSASWE